MAAVRRVKDALRGQVKPTAVFLEAGRRARVALQERYDRLIGSLEKKSARAVQLNPEFARMSTDELLEHFHARSKPKFFEGFQQPPQTVAQLHSKYFPEETESLMRDARKIVTEHSWPLLGFGGLAFGDEIDWLADPVSGVAWPLEYHTNSRTEGGDIRVLWELNRLGHLITLGRAYVLSGEEDLAEEFFKQVEGWNSQNPIGCGPNWSCAMEVALRAMNLLAAFHLFRRAHCLSPERFAYMVRFFGQHGEYIRRHLEFSYIATSNHYLTNVVGLFWLGICLPELQAAEEWRSFGLREMQREMDKQVLGDGAHYESSTGYHRFVLELFLFSFILCQSNSIEIPEKYWQRLRAMLEYTRAYLRPDGRAPVIGDTDSGQVLPIVWRSASEHAHLLSIGAVLFNEPTFKVETSPSQELCWMLGPESLKRFEDLDSGGLNAVKSSAFSEAGVFVLRQDDLYLLFNASGVGLNGRGSHSHNDALSVEVSACGTNFLGDPGTFVYTGDLAQRQFFRSTGYHSTVEIDGEEQNRIEEATPFRTADEAHPRVLSWGTGEHRDYVVAEHYGYLKLKNGPITHRRAVTFDKTNRYWLIEDTFKGTGAHVLKFVFHLFPDLEVSNSGVDIAKVFHGVSSAEVRDRRTGARLLIVLLYVTEQVEFEPRWFSHDYGAKVQSLAACWTVRAAASPFSVRWLLIPICTNEDHTLRLRLIEQSLQSEAW